MTASKNLPEKLYPKERSQNSKKWVVVDMCLQMHQLCFLYRLLIYSKVDIIIATTYIGM